MPRFMKERSTSKYLTGFALIVFLLLSGAASILRAQEKGSEDLEKYKLRLDGEFFYSSPSGTLQGQALDVPIDFQKDLGFASYPTFGAKVDWKFTRKNHLYVSFGQFNTDHSTTLQRTITFNGTTFNAGLQAQSQLHVFLISPGYQYDIIRRRRGHLGIGLQMNILDNSATISAQAQVITTPTGTITPAATITTAAKSASASLIAPLPVAGPQYRLYLTNSPRLFVEGDLYGMYFFGYGNFISTENHVGLNLSNHFAATVGYQLASRLVVTPSSERFDMHLTQKGVIAGLEYTF
jgi:hypothetical protein